MNLFGKKDYLPVHGGNKKSNGLSGIPVINFMVLLSVIWVIVSILSVVFGIYHCRLHSTNFEINCTSKECHLIGKSPQFNRNIKFPKSDFISAEAIRINKVGEYVDMSIPENRRQSRLGHSIKLKVKLPPEESNGKFKLEKSLILSPTDMGRRQARTGSARANRYIENRLDEKEEKSDKIKMSIKAGKSVTALGLLSIFFGLASFIFSILFGQFKDQTTRRMKKSS